MKKNITFEEEKRKEFLYVLFNALFVCACIVFVLNFLGEALADKIYAVMSPNSSDLGDNLLRAFIMAAALTVPFAIYAKKSDVSFSNMFIPKKKSPLFFVFGTLCVVGISVPTVVLSDKLIGLLGKFGYVMHEYLPYDFDSLSANIISMIFVSILSAASGEIVFRGIVTERFRRANTGLGLLLAAVLAMGFSGSLVKMPYILISGIILSWLYMKTSSLYVTFTAALVRDLAMYSLYLYGDALAPYMTVICIACLAVAVISGVILVLRYGIRTVYPAPRDDDDEYLRLSAKESVKGLFTSFAFWIFFFGSIFTILFFYLSNPTIVGP